MNKFIYKYFKLLGVISLLLLFYLSFSDNLLTSNLSRNGNKSIKLYIFLFLLCLSFGAFMFISLKIQGFKKIPYIGLFSLLIGGIIPYNYLDSFSLNSNLHLICAYISLGLTFIIEMISLFNYERINKRINKVFKICLFVIGLYTIYQFGTYMFINTLVELLYIGLIIISQLLISNSIM